MLTMYFLGFAAIMENRKPLEIHRSNKESTNSQLPGGKLLANSTKGVFAVPLPPSDKHNKGQYGISNNSSKPSGTQTKCKTESTEMAGVGLMGPPAPPGSNHSHQSQSSSGRRSIRLSDDGNGCVR